MILVNNDKWSKIFLLRDPATRVRHCTEGNEVGAKWASIFSMITCLLLEIINKQTSDQLGRKKGPKITNGMV